jgi:hypothetical protein
MREFVWSAGFEPQRVLRDPAGFVKDNAAPMWSIIKREHRREGGHNVWQNM